MKSKLLHCLGVAVTTGLMVPLLTVARPLGIDVSSFQGSSVNWTSVKAAGITFAWAKATEGTTVTDSTFSGNMSRGKAAGVAMGAYDFAHPESNTPAAESGHFWGVAGSQITADGKSFTPMLDFEVFSGHVGASSLADWANQWCFDIQNDASLTGVAVKPIIYTSACSACNFNTSVAQWFSDVADYNGQSSQTSTPWTTCTGCEVWGAGVWNVWQYTDCASVSGVSGCVDGDVINGTSITPYLATGTTHHLTNRVAVIPTTNSLGYWIAASDGGVFSFGNAQFYGSMGGQHLNAPIVGMAARPQSDGYWLVGSDGGIFTYGAAGFYGSEGGVHLNQPIVGMCSTASGNGYWLVAKDGGIFAFGDAPFQGSVPGAGVNVVNIVGMARNPANGYWVVGSDGGIYSFAANFYGSLGGTHLNAPIVGMSARHQGDGYWLVGSDGGIVTYGAAGFYGSMGGSSLPSPMCGTAGTSSGAGYWEVGKDGAIYSFGNAAYYGGANY